MSSPPDECEVVVSLMDNMQLWRLVLDHLDTAFPLRGMTWRSRSSGNNFHTIDSLQVAWVPYNTESLRPIGNGPYDPQLPFGHVFFVGCETENDYKNTVRKMLLKWLSEITAAEREWLVVYLPLGAQTASDLTERQYKKVFEKIRGDVVTRLTERRCIRLDLNCSVVREREAQLRSFVVGMTDMIVTSLTARCGAFEEQVRRLYDEQMTNPLWEFCKFVVVKERLANLYRQVGLLEECLRQYEELEASLFVSMASSDRSTRFHGLRNLPLQVGEDAGHVLDLARKPYVQLVHENCMTLHDMQQYLFAQRAHLLFALERPEIVADMAVRFIGGVLTDLQEQVASNVTAQAVADSWIYSACVDVADMCQRQAAPMLASMSSKFAVNTSASVRLLITLGDLLSLARKKLASLGWHVLRWKPPTCEYCWLPSDDDERGKTPALVPVPGTVDPDGHPLPTVTSNGALAEKIAHQASLEELYLWITQAIATYYDHAGRERFACILSMQRAAIFLQHQDWSAAMALLQAQAKRCESGWSQLYVHATSQLTRCLLQLEYWELFISHALWLLDPDTIAAVAPCVPDTMNVAAAVDRLMDLVHEVAHKRLTTKIDSPITTLATLHLSDSRSTPGAAVLVAESIDLCVDVHWRPSAPLKCDEVWLQLTRSEPVSEVGGWTGESAGDLLHISLPGGNVLCPGSNKLHVAVGFPLPGTYVVSQFCVRVGNLILTESHVPWSNKAVTGFTVQKRPAPIGSTVAVPRGLIGARWTLVLTLPHTVSASSSALEELYVAIEPPVGTSVLLSACKCFNETSGQRSVVSTAITAQSRDAAAGHGSSTTITIPAPSGDKTIVSIPLTSPPLARHAEVFPIKLRATVQGCSISDVVMPNVYNTSISACVPPRVAWDSTSTVTTTSGNALWLQVDCHIVGNHSVAVDGGQFKMPSHIRVLRTIPSRPCDNVTYLGAGISMEQSLRGRGVGSGSLVLGCRSEDGVVETISVPVPTWVPGATVLARAVEACKHGTACTIEYTIQFLPSWTGPPTVKCKLLYSDQWHVAELEDDADPWKSVSVPRPSGSVVVTFSSAPACFGVVALPTLVCDFEDAAMWVNPRHVVVT